MLYINLVLGILFLFLVGRYLFSIYREGLVRPEEWAASIKSGKISGDLLKEYRRYKDKQRFFAWWLQVEELKRKQVKGCFAELGVYKGESARILHFMDPDRVFHLFDTFEGFQPSELKKETGEAATYSEKSFADTSLEGVKSYLAGIQRFVFHPGVFPKTTESLEKEKFALVNLDADLYEPTRAALTYFYPRLSPGGVIFIHDVNSRWEGCRKAVREFARTIPEVPVMIPDSDGTVILIKNNPVNTQVGIDGTV